MTAVLAVLALAGAIGTATRWVGDDDPLVDQTLTDITQQRDELLAQNTELSIAFDRVTAERDEAAQRLETLNGELAATAASRDELSTRLVTATSRLGVATSNFEHASANLTAVRAELSDARAELAASTAHAEEMSASVASLQATLKEVTAERDALAAMFPIEVDASLAGEDITGTYSARWFTGYNSGLPDVVLPSQVTVVRTAEGWLRVIVPGVVDAGLLAADGALVTVVDSADLLPPVDGIARLARVAVTVHAAETVTLPDGTTTVTDLGLTVAISTTAAGSVPAGVALFAARLAPTG